MRHEEALSASETQKAIFGRWHTEFIRLLDVRTTHARRHLIQPKDAEIEARKLLLAHAKKRIPSHLIQKEWFHIWLEQLMAQADTLANLARQNNPGTGEIIRARQLVDVLSRKIPGDVVTNIDWHYLSIVYRLGPEDSVIELLEHPCRHSHSSGNTAAELEKARKAASRMEAATKELGRQLNEAVALNESLSTTAQHATELLQKIMLTGQHLLPNHVLEGIHDFFKSTGSSDAG